MIRLVYNFALWEIGHLNFKTSSYLFSYMNSQSEPFLSKCPDELIPLASDLISSAKFQRLKGISFLGAIERLGNPDGVRSSAGSRYDHSIGVANIALQLSQAAQLSAGELRITLIHGLLHDVGHGPMSHSCEFFFRKKFGWDHHRQLLSIILDKQNSLSKILRKYCLWHDYASFIQSPDKFPKVQAIFESPINADTIEGILRASKFFGVPVEFDEQLLINSFHVSSMSLRKLDRFWSLKNRIYNQHILSYQEARFDAAVSAALFFYEDAVGKHEFLLNDAAFEEMYLPQMQKYLDEFVDQEHFAQRKRRNFNIEGRVRPRKLGELNFRYKEMSGGQTDGFSRETR